MEKKRKFLASFIAVVMIFTMMPAYAFGATVSSSDFVDMPNDWSTDALQKAVSNGLISGFDEAGGKYIRPASVLTRAQMATIVNRAFGAENQTYLSGVTDVPAGEWYAKDMAKAVGMGTFMLASNMRPNDPITRQEAFTVLARAFKLTDKNNASSLNNFTDGDNVASYARASVCAMIDAKYLAGSNGYLYPTSNITRAEFAKVMDNLVKRYCDNSGEIFTVSSITGNVMVNETDVTIKNTTIRGDLIIGDGVGSADLTLDNVDVTGRTVVRGGGLNTITIKSNCDIPSITIAKIEGNVRVVVDDGGVVDLVNIDDGDDDVILEGEFGTVNINHNLPVTFNDCIIEYVYANATTTMTMDKDTEVDRVTVAKAATGTKVINNGLITKLTSDIKVTLSGTGTVTENLATGGTLTVTSVAAVVGTPKVGSQLTVGTIKPSGATVTYQWKRASSSSGTYSSISGATSKTYTPVAADVGKYLKVAVTGKNSYTGTVTSVATAVVTTSKITATTINGVTAPAQGATPDTSVTATTEYTATISWSPSDSTYAAGVSYTATITLSPKDGYTLTGITANQFKVSGASATNSANSGKITAVFPATSGAAASGISSSLSALPSPEENKVLLTVSTSPQSGHDIYYRIVNSSPTARTVGEIISPSTWTEVLVQTAQQITVSDGKYFEIVELNSSNGVVKWGKEGPTTDGFPVPIPASGISITLDSLSPAEIGKIQITDISAASQGYSMYYRVVGNNPSAPAVGSTFSSSGWTLITETSLPSVSASDGDYIEAVEVAGSSVTRWGESEPTNDGISVVSLTTITGVMPEIGQVPTTSIDDTTQYTAVISWNPGTEYVVDTPFEATITLSAKDGYTFSGVSSGRFVVDGGDIDSVNNTGDIVVIKATFQTSSPSGEV